MSFKSNGYKSIEEHRKHREKWKRGYRARTGAYKWNRRWAKDEIERVIEHNISDRELSKEIEHSVSAIQKMRWRVKEGIIDIDNR